MIDPSFTSFGLDTYKEIIRRLKEAGYEIRPVSSMREPCSQDQKITYFRHDVDLFLEGVPPMAEVERELGVTSTYFIPLTQPFNVLYADNANIIRQLMDWGHEIGLHYDLKSYPAGRDAQSERLRLELRVLESVTGKSVDIITMHNPFLNMPDPFLKTDEFLNPRDPRLQEGLLYVSDSSRAWRDDSLLRCFSERNAPPRLLLLTHPEWWLDPTIPIVSEYIEKVLAEQAPQQIRRYFLEYIAGMVRIHPPVKAYETRLREEGLI